MADPNLVALTTVRGRTSALAVTTTPQDLVVNPAGSGKVLRVLTVYACNITSVNSPVITLRFVRSGVAFHLANKQQIPSGENKPIVSKDAPVTLEQGDKLVILAGANAQFEAVASFDEMG